MPPSPEQFKFETGEGKEFFEEKGEKPSEEKEKIDYSQSGLKFLKIEEPVIEKERRVFARAEGIEAGRVEAADAFMQAKKCKAEEVKVQMWAFEEAESCDANIVEALIAFNKARSCRAKNIKANFIFQSAEGCEADVIEAKKVAFPVAKKCIVNEVWAGEEIFSRAQISLITKRVESPIIGKSSRGVVILGEAKGEIFPSVILMKDKTKEKAPEVEGFFKKELKTQEGTESIFNYLSYFNWEGETLEKGKKKLQERYEKNRENFKEFDGKSLKEYDFYFLLDDNSKREEIFKGFPALRKIEKAALLRLNEILPQFRGFEEYPHVLSLKDWVRLGEMKPFLSLDKNEIGNMKKEFDKITAKEILESPEKYKTWDTAKHIKNLRAREREINLNLIEKEFQKERDEKIGARIRDYMLNSPLENIKGYLKKETGFEGELNEDLVFAARMHKILAEKTFGERVENKEKKILEKLIGGQKLIDFEGNKRWLSEMKEKVDTSKWLSHHRMEFLPLPKKEYYSSIETKKEILINELVEHLRQVGIGVAPKIEEIERTISEKKEEIPPTRRAIIKMHLSDYKSLIGIEKSEPPQKIILETEEEPLKAIQMGEKVSSCLSIGGGQEHMAVRHAASINKKVIWAKNEKGEILGRVLGEITEEGKLTRYEIYSNDPRLELKPYFQDFLDYLAKEINTETTTAIAKEDIEIE